jgi:SAM-dependent methyltransferase
MTLRLKRMAAFAKGKTLDVGFANLPNPYLQGCVIGLDLKFSPAPENYSAVVLGDMTHVCFAPASFDTIVAGEFIEHLEQPVEFLRDSRSLLRTGGTLVLSTPNPYYPPIILLNWLMIRKYYYSPNHIFEIAPRYMVRLLEQTGFVLREMLADGMLLPLGRGRTFTIPLPRAICYHLIYVAKAV